MIMFKSTWIQDSKFATSPPFAQTSISTAAARRLSINMKSLFSCYTVYQVFSACIHFPLCSREFQNSEKFNRINLMCNLANNVDFKALTSIS